MTLHHGGWALLAKLSGSAADTAKGDFTLERNLTHLTNGDTRVAGTLANFSPAGFDAYGSDYTVRVAVDVNND